MKRLLKFFFAALLFFPLHNQSQAGEIDNRTVVISRHPKIWKTFPLSEVRLLPGSPFHHAMEVSQRYLLDMDVDRMLNGLRKRVDLPEKGAYPGSNQPEGTRPGDLPHYMSGTSLMYAQTGDSRFLERINYIIDEMCKVRDIFHQKGERVHYDFEKILSGELLLNRPDDWGAPWGGTSGNTFYTIHKYHAGLRDAYLYCGNPKALELWREHADQIADFVLACNPDLFDGFLDIEHGGMNAVYADLYALTGDERYMEVSRRFNHQKVILNIADGHDVLYGRHANFQTPTFEGTARQYQLTGDEVSRQATGNFLDMAYSGHINCIGGNSCYERFGRPGETTKRLGYTSSETCNTYNMLKVALNAFESGGELRHMDYFERALYNHILASQDPETGGVTYYTSTIPGGFKSYSDRFNLQGVWCCVGTGMENHSKYGEAIYFNNGNVLLVNLFIPSTLNWEEKGLRLSQKTDFPQTDRTTLTIEECGSYDAPIYVRYPQWAESGVRVSINGERIPVKARRGEYIPIAHSWKKGDIIEIEMPQTFRLEAAKDDPYMNAICRGPIVYAGILGSDHMPADRVNSAGNNNRVVPENDIPTFTADKSDLDSWIKPTGKHPMEYITTGAGTLYGKKKELTLLPYYMTHHTRYSLYLKVYTPQEMALRKRVVIDELRPSYADDEKAHNMQCGTSRLVSQGGHSPALGFNSWEHTRLGREADDWFSYDMKTTPGQTNYLVVTYWGNENEGHEFDVTVNGVKLASEILFDKVPLTFYETVYEIPAEAIAAGGKATVAFRGHDGKKAGTVFALRTTTDPEKFPNYSFYF